MPLADKAFPETSLVVEEELANPSPEDGKLIDADNAAIAASYAKAAGEPQFRHPFRQPAGKVTSTFGEWRTFNDGHRAQHLGLDLAAQEGSKVAAVDDGTVVLVRETFLAGNVVVIAHGGGIASLYFHLQKPTVAEGDHVRQGERIGLAGHTGRTTGPHLHISIRVGWRPHRPAGVLQAEDQSEWLARRVTGAHSAKRHAFCNFSYVTTRRGFRCAT